METFIVKIISEELYYYEVCIYKKEVIIITKKSTDNLTELTFNKEELFQNEDFIKLVKDYNSTLKKLKKAPKTLDELFDICYDKWINADLSDDLLFGMFCDDIEVSTKLVNLFLKSKNIDIGEIKKIERQKVLDLGFDIRGVRFDVLVKGCDKVINIEMQAGTAFELELRMRFYQAILDIHLLPKGGKDSYNLLPETFIIFICTDKDVVGEGELEYHINPYAHIKNNNSYKLFNTKTNWIVYNALAYKNFDKNSEHYDEELYSFFAFLKNEPIENQYTDYFHKHFIKIKSNQEMGRNFMLSRVRDMEKFYEGYNEGFDKAAKQAAEELKAIKLATKQATKQAAKQAAEELKAAEKAAKQAAKQAAEELKAAEKAAEKAAKKAAEKAAEKAAKQTAEEAYEEKVNMVLKMISKNYDDDEITDIVQLPIEEIASIREKHSK